MRSASAADFRVRRDPASLKMWRLRTLPLLRSMDDVAEELEELGLPRADLLRLAAAVRELPAEPDEVSI